MLTVNATRAFVAVSPVQVHTMYVCEERQDGSISVTRARYDSAYLNVKRKSFVMPPRHEWSLGGWRYEGDATPRNLDRLSDLSLFDQCLHHHAWVCGHRIVRLAGDVPGSELNGVLS